MRLFVWLKFWGIPSCKKYYAKTVNIILGMNLDNYVCILKSKSSFTILYIMGYCIFSKNIFFNKIKLETSKKVEIANMGVI